MGRAPSPLGDKIVVSTVAGASHKDYPLARIPNNVSYEDASDQPEAQPNQPLAMPLSFHGGMAYSKYDPNVAGALLNQGLITSEPNVIGAARVITAVALTGAANPPQYFFETAVNDSGADDGDPVLYIIAPEAAEINVYKVSLAATGDNGTANAAVTTTNTTLTDTRESWTTNEWAARVVICNSKTMTVTSNTATTLTGASWSGGGNPGDGNSWVLGLGGFGYVANIKTFAVTPTQPMGRPTEWNDGTNTQWRVPTGDTTNDIQSLESCVSGIAADTWGSGDADARFLRVVKNQLYRTTASNEVSILANATDPETEASWGDEFYVGDAGTKITDLLEVNGISYICKEDGLYEWDGISEAEKVLYTGRAVRNGQGAVYWHGGFLIPADGLWWTRTGKPVGPDSNPYNRGNDPSRGDNRYVKHGRWMGLAAFGAYIYALYLSSNGTDLLLLQGQERESGSPGWGPITWQILSFSTGNDDDDFCGLFITETSELSAGVTRPVLFLTYGNDVRYLFLDKDGSPVSRRGEIDVAGDSFEVCSGELDFGMPRVTKQLRVIEGWAEDMGTGDTWQFFVYRDGGSYNAVGATITEDGFFQRFWTQDTNDTTRSMLVGVTWNGGTAITDTNGPLIRDPVVRAVALPKITRVWTFLLTARDEQAKTGKLVRSELEAYVNDLKKFKLPDSDSFNGVLTSLRLLRADEVRNLTPRNQEPPHYIIETTVREMISS